MSSLTVDIRSAERRDAAGISQVHDEAWRLAYAGIIPGMHLTRMVERRGPAWWAATLEKSRGGIMVASIADKVVGYCSMGPARRVGSLSFDAEVFELYVKPEYQGLGFGTRLFRAARDRLSQNGRGRTLVWALADNEPAITFYTRRGGAAVLRDQERFGGATLPKIGFGFGLK